jgi:hypothetical protein
MTHPLRTTAWLLTAAAAIAGSPPPGAQPAHAAEGCRYFELTSILVNVRRDPGRPGGYLDVLEKGDVACVTEQRKLNDATWAFVREKTADDGSTSDVGGWANMRYLTPGTAPGAAKTATATAPPAPKVAVEVAKPAKPTEPATTASPPTPPPPTAGTATTPAAKAEGGAPKPQRTAAATPNVDPEVFRFDHPVPFGAYPVRGHTLEELLDGKPLFSPIEGLEDELWKKPCSTCHQWNKERLCEQGTSYIKAAKYVLRHQHPYGGPYKLALMRWAKTGCQ